MYCAKWNKSDRKRQIPYDFTYMWNLKYKINKWDGNRLIDTENKLMVARREGVGGMGEKGAGIKKYKLVVAGWSQEHGVQHRKCGQ